MQFFRAALCFQLSSADGQPPEWIELIPAPSSDGLIRGRDGRAFRMPAAESVAARFSLRLPVDINHSTEIAAPKGGESPAAAWVEELQARNGALWGRVEWTDMGGDAYRGKKYRFVSPAFTHAKSGEIHALTSVALTNTPNFDLALNSAPTPALPRNSAGEGVSEEDSTMLTALLAALGLSTTATEADAVTAVNALKADKQTALNAASAPPLEKFVPRADYDAALNRASTSEAELKNIRDANRDAAIEADVSAAQKAGKITPATREYYVAMCKREGGLEEFRKVVAAATPVLDPEKSGAEGDPSKAKGALTDSQKAMCSRLGITETDYQAALGAAA